MNQQPTEIKLQINTWEDAKLHEQPERDKLKHEIQITLEYSFFEKAASEMIQRKG